MGKLYIVGTPIGNLGDFSQRGIDTLLQVDFIAAEDTRLSRGLLTHFKISTPMISYHKHNSRERGSEIIRRLIKGEDCALITDAGMPAISDPGEDLVRLCHENNVTVVVVPGPTALTSALALSGLNTRRFIFEGFLEGKSSEKKQRLVDIKSNTRTLVYYESPHSLVQTLVLMVEVLGNRRLAICREITKIYEEVLHFTLESAVDYYKNSPPRGEFVLIVEGNLEKPETMSLEQAVNMVIARSKQETSLSNAAKEVAEISGHKKTLLYKNALMENID